MNKENMLKVADLIENEMRIGEKRVRFNMEKWVCGTAACVAGHAFLMDLPEHRALSYLNEENNAHVWTVASGILDLSYVQSSHLFCGEPEATIDSRGYELSTINRNKKLVPDAIRWMAETGEVSWEKGFKYARCVREEKSR